MRIGSLFTGYGGLDLAVEAVFGGRTVWTSDVDPGACKIIAHRFPDAPNHGDITTIDWADVEPVDVLAGGWPCQPFSQAGKRKGAADERALWPEVARAVRALRPRYVVLENVSAIATVRTGPELQRAVGSLAALGYVGSWLCVRASDVGAPHRRERIFIVATDTEDIGHQRVRTSRIGGTGPEDRGRGPVALLPTPAAMNPNDGESVETWEARRLPTKERVENGFGTPLSIAVQLLPTPRAQSGEDRNSRIWARPLDQPQNLENALALLPTPRATDGTKGGPNQSGSSGDLMMSSAMQPERFGQFAAAVGRWASIIGRPAPDPTISGRNGAPRLNPRFVEWMMGAPDGWVCDVPGLTRAAQLKALGNGVVPQQAAAAIDYMASR